ncbi:PREDICTED: uncharacterized protein LOC106123413 [Papilio xuthus]|uniref:Uncharacterized protein LOC106123413 n=1 Tax=Papilio xuthus TaxID=66420 RepID=A0AAJ6ZLM2_PAPXU|nr:PREDICTED: uncharacterized protein LOC106123413 [Papilio xuthus]
MGYKLIILLGLLLGVLYCIHILVQDYQAVTASKLLRFLFKRDTSPNYTKPSVRWRKILMYDKIQCTRFLYCALGAAAEAGPDGELPTGLILMLSLEPRGEDKDSLEVFQNAYEFGRNAHTLCQIHVYDMHQDEHLYPGSETFIPERFLPENTNRCYPYAYSL